jgi:cytochrome c-type biogenesis protein CcmH
MTGLLFAGALFIVVSIWFIARPVMATSLSSMSQRHELEVVRDRLLAQLNELDSERADHGVDIQVAQDEELRLSAELAEVLKRLEATGVAANAGQDSGSPRRLQMLTIATLAVGITAIGGGLYALHNGAMLGNLAQIAAGGPGAGQVPPMVLEMVARLEKRLAEQPNDPAGWTRLGVSYANLGRIEDAKKAYARAYTQAPDDLEMISEYAWLLYSENPSATDGLVFELYQKLYLAQPQNPDALWFLGYASYQKGDYKKTIKYWDRLLKVLPPDSPTVEHVRNAIAKARRGGK